MLGPSERGYRRTLGSWPTHLLLAVLGKCGQTGFAGTAAVVCCGCRLLQLTSVRMEKSHSLGAPHIVPARSRETKEVRAARGCAEPL